MHTTSVSLLRRLRKPGQSEAWAQFVQFYSPMVYAWACQMGLQDADAEDLVQDVFETLVKKLPEFHYDDHKSFRAWLCTITRNKWRNKQRRHQLPIDKEAQPDDFPAADQESLDEIELRRHLLARIVSTVEQHFEASTWQAFWRHVIEGRSAQEVAKELGVGVGAIYTAKCRVLAYLSKEMGEAEISN